MTGAAAVVPAATVSAAAAVVCSVRITRTVSACTFASLTNLTAAAAAVI